MNRNVYAPCILLFLMVILPDSLTFAQEAPEEVAEENTDEQVQHHWTVDTSFSYQSGDYGTAEKSKNLSLPITLKRHLPDGEVAITIPYIYQEGGSSVTTTRNGIFRRRTITTTTQNSTESGVGDITLSGRYFCNKLALEALNLTGWDLNVALFGEVKFPNTDNDSNLGTREFDYTAGIEISRPMTEKWTLSGAVYYTFVGEPEGESYDNQLSFSFGPGYNFTKNTQGTLSYSESTAIVDGEDNQRMINLGINHQLNNALQIYAAGGFGLTDSSPDFSATTGLSYSFN